jgi:hypothetical protein
VEWITSGPWQSLWATCLLIGITAVLTAAGNRFVSLQPSHFVEKLSHAEVFLFSSAAGFGLLTLLLLVIGVVGLVRLEWVIGTLVLLAVIGRWPQDIRPGSAPSGLSAATAILWIWMGVLLAGSWIQALAPPIGTDALSYHLHHPKLFIEAQRLFFIPRARESLWPYLTEMLFMIGLMIQGTTLAQLFHWIFYPLTAAAVYAFALRFYGRREALMAAVFFLLCPMGFAQSGHCYVDLSLAFFTFLIFYGFALRAVTGEGRAAGLAGWAAGGALATKYLGLSSVMIATVFWFIRSKHRCRNALIFLSVAGIVSVGWYLHSWIRSGNPVYPFFPHIFGAGLDFDISEGAGFSKRLPDFLKFGWDIAMYPRVFGGEVFGAQYLIFVPLLAFYWKGSKQVSREMALFTLIYTFLLFKQSQYARFYLSVAPFLAIGAAVALSEMLREKNRALKAVVIGAFVFLIVLQSGIAWHRLGSVWGVVSGRQSGEAYLMDKERSFKGFLYIREHAKPGDTVLNSGDVRHFYSAHPGTVMDTLFLRKELKERGKSILDLLEEKQFDFIWHQDDPEIEAYAKKAGYDAVYAYDFTEGPQTWRLTVYESPAHRRRETPAPSR